MTAPTQDQAREAFTRVATSFVKHETDLATLRAFIDAHPAPPASDDIHTCSYECERPACIRAQRDELVARMSAPPASEGAAVEAALRAHGAYWSDEAHSVKCVRCHGIGVYASDLCHTCGGSGATHEGTEEGAMLAALTAAGLPALRARVVELEEGYRNLMQERCDVGDELQALQTEAAELRETVAGPAVKDVVFTLRERGIWRAAITLGNNICVDESDRINGVDGPADAIDATSECAKRIRQYAEPTDEQLAEMLLEARVSLNLWTGNEYGDVQRYRAERDAAESERDALRDRLTAAEQRAERAETAIRGAVERADYAIENFPTGHPAIYRGTVNNIRADLSAVIDAARQQQGESSPE